ncbi:MAG TPA: STAS domain-containing protein [Bryobacteraceae bacterium]
MEHHPTQDVTVEILAGAGGDIRIIKLRGPLTIHNFFDFQNLTREQPAPRDLIVDLTEVPYIDSAALGSLVGIHVSYGKAGRKYALANERLERVFVISGVDQFLVTYPTVADAEAALRNE